MIKKFFITFLGSMAAIWVSAFLSVFVFIAVMVAIAGSLDSDSSKAEVKSGSVLHLVLDGNITERKEPQRLADAIYGELNKSQSLADITGAIYHAAHDSRIDGIYIECKGASAGTAARQAIDEALHHFSETGKWIMAYADAYTQGDYFNASAAEEIWLNPLGSVDIHGLSGTTMFYTGLLEKLGVKMQVLRVGTFKSAVEPYMLKEMSPASRMQQQVYMNSIWNSVKNTIAENRNIPADSIDILADELIFTAPATASLDARLVTNLGYRHQAQERVAELANKDKFDDVNLVDTKSYAATLDLGDYSFLPGVTSSKGKTIAVLYATGEISDSGSEGIVGDEMVDEIMKLADDADNMAGLILRVNSPGGSAFASEQIWEALQQFKERTELPLYVSMGDVAASGGYYISCGADVIYAQPTTLTGSIGIFGMIPEVQGLLNNHLGITTATVSTNRNGDFPSFFSPMTAEQQAKMQAYIERGYDTFTRRCAEGRHMELDSLRAIAEGRVWDGALAQQIGLVDRMGSLHKVITDMAEDLGLDSYNVQTYPKSDLKWWEELLEMEELTEMSTRLGLEPEGVEALYHLQKLRQAPTVQCRMEPVEIKL